MRSNYRNSVYWAFACNDCDCEDFCYEIDYCEKQNCELDQVRRKSKINLDDFAFDMAISLFDELTNNKGKEDDISIQKNTKEN